jgi:hypothetical protein
MVSSGGPESQIGRCHGSGSGYDLPLLCFPAAKRVVRSFSGRPRAFPETTMKIVDT